MSWDDAQQRAGLDPAAVRGPAKTVPELCAQFAEEIGKLPAGMNQLVRWAKSRRIAMQDPTASQVDRACKEVQRQRREQGLPRLERAVARERLPWSRVEGLEPGNRRTLQDWDDREAIIAGLAKAIPLAPDGQMLTQQILKALAKEVPGIPGWKTVNELAKKEGVDFAALRTEATAQVPSPAGA